MSNFQKMNAYVFLNNEGNSFSQADRKTRGYNQSLRSLPIAHEVYPTMSKNEISAIKWVRSILFDARYNCLILYPK